MAITTVPSTIEFDATIPGYIDEDGGLTPAGQDGLDAHYDQVDFELRRWARSQGNVTVTFTDHVRVTAHGESVARGGFDNLTESPASWVDLAEEALSEIVERVEERAAHAA